MAQTVLHIDSSARTEGSVSRDLSAKIVSRLDPDRVIRRDLAEVLPQIDAEWIGANFTPEADRTDAQREVLALSDALIAELMAADTIVIGTPVYNFSVPTALRGWIDLVARAGVTFRYTPDGPKGLLEGKRAIVAIASGGTQIGSDIDFASGYIRHILGFIGITDLEFISADQLMIDAKASLGSANDAVELLAA